MRFKRGDVLLYRLQPEWDIDYSCKIKYVWWFFGWVYKIEFSDKSGNWYDHEYINTWFHKPSKLEEILK